MTGSASDGLPLLQVPPFRLLDTFVDGDVEVQELLMIARCVWVLRDAMRAWSDLPTTTCASERTIVTECLNEFLMGYQNMTDCRQLLTVAGPLRRLMATYNTACRLRITDTTTWPRGELMQLQKRFSPALIPPQTPCEIMDESAAWWAWGQYAEPERWIGHGYAPHAFPVREVMCQSRCHVETKGIW